MKFLYYKRDFRESSRKDLIYKGLRHFLGGIMVIFDGVKSGEMLDFSGGLSKWISNSKWWFRCGNIRYALSINRAFAPKCKPRPTLKICIFVWKCKFFVLWINERFPAASETYFFWIFGYGKILDG